VNWRSRSFKVIDFCCNRKPIYDFLLVINCHLSSISPFLRYNIAKSKTMPLYFEPPDRGPPSNFVINQTWQAKRWGIGLHFSENCMILTAAVLPQYTRVSDRQTTDRQMTYYDNSRTLYSNGRLKMCLPEHCLHDVLLPVTASTTTWAIVLTYFCFTSLLQ